MAIGTWKCKHPRFCVHFSRQNKDKQACSSRQPACAQLGSRTLGLGRFPPTLPKPPPGHKCSIVSLTPVTRLAPSWPTSQSPALFSASPPVDLNSCCSTNSWETQGVTTKVNHCQDNSGLVFSQPLTTTLKSSHSPSLRQALWGFHALKSFNFEQGNGRLHSHNLAQSHPYATHRWPGKRACSHK